MRMKPNVNRKEKLLVIGFALLLAILLSFAAGISKSQVTPLESLEYDGSTLDGFNSSVLGLPEDVVRIHAWDGRRAPFIQRSYGQVSRAIHVVPELLPPRLGRSDE